MQPILRNLTIAFFLLTIMDLIAIISGVPLLQFIAKPLLIPVLMLLLYIIPYKNGSKKLLLFALLFSWLGDVFLLAESCDPHFFIAGLGCFLTTHICYILFFLCMDAPERSLLLKQPLWLFLILAYGLALIWLLFPRLGGLTFPVILYAAVICTMLLCSLHAYTKSKRPANLYYVIGAAAFVVSDSILAVNKFYRPFKIAGVLIMLMYCAAQYCIVRGFMEQVKKGEDQSVHVYKDL